MKELIIVPLMVIIIMGIWNLKLEKFLQRTLQKHLDKEAKKTTAIFIDPH